MRVEILRQQHGVADIAVCGSFRPVGKLLSATGIGIFRFGLFIPNACAWLRIAFCPSCMPRFANAVVQEMVNLSPRGIREMLRLNRPVYVPTSAYGHFGRTPDRVKDTFTWERTDILAPELKRAFGR